MIYINYKYSEGKPTKTILAVLIMCNPIQKNKHTFLGILATLFRMCNEKT